MGMTNPRRSASVAALVLAASVLCGCTAPTSPHASPPTASPSFTSKAEAFAAAERTYRAYIEALNQIDLSDPRTFEGVYAWTAGESADDERKNLSVMHADRWVVTGETKLKSFLGRSFHPDETPVVVAVACTDVSSIQLVDESGVSQVNAERPDGYALEVGFNVASSETGLRIASSNAVESSQCS